MQADDGKDPKTYSFTVNGIKLESQHGKLVALDILKLAKDKEAFPGNPESYLLQGDKEKYKLEDWADLEVDNSLITIPTEPTPVA